MATLSNWATNWAHQAVLDFQHALEAEKKAVELRARARASNSEANSDSLREAANEQQSLADYWLRCAMEDENISKRGETALTVVGQW